VRQTDNYTSTQPRSFLQAGCPAWRPTNSVKALKVSRYQTGKTNLDLTEARDSEWQWHQLGHMQVCTLLQTDNHARSPPSVFTGWMPFLPPNQHHQSTEGKYRQHLSDKIRS